MSITTNHIKENLCFAHIYALAGMAGVVLGTKFVHDYGVDGDFERVELRGKRRVVVGLSIQFQAKASTNWELKDGHIVYDLESKSYNDMVSRSAAQTTMILVLLCLPEKFVDWHQSTPAGTTLKNCCYWHLVQGTPVANEKSTKRIKIPVAQQLTPASLLELLEAETARRMGQLA